MESHSGPVPGEDTPRYAALMLDGLSLLLPQHQIYTLEPISDVESAGEGHDHVGWIKVEGERWPVYCLSANLHLSREIPDTHRICVLLTHGQGYLGLLCERVVAAAETQARLFTLPACMRMPSTPIDALALDGQEQVSCVTSVSHLAASIAQRTQCLSSEQAQDSSEQVL